MRFRESWSLLAGRATIALLFITQDASATISPNSTIIGNNTTANRNSSATISNHTLHTSPWTKTASLTSRGFILSHAANTSTLVSTNKLGVSTTRNNTLPPLSTTHSGTQLSPNGTSTTRSNALPSLSTTHSETHLSPNGTSTTRSNALPSLSTTHSETHLSPNGTSTIPSGSSTHVPTSSAGTASGTGNGNSSSTGVPVVPVVGVITSVIVQSGKTVTDEIITGSSLTGPITIAPASTTYASSQATSAVSSVSSQLAAIVPIILAWKKNPTPELKTDALNKVTGTKDDVMGLIDNLGTKPDPSPCGSKKSKRFSLPIIGDVVNALTCIGSELDQAKSKISGGDVEGVDDIVSTINSELPELEDQNDDDKTKSDDEDKTKSQSDDKTKSQSDSSTSTKSSKSSSGSSSSSRSCTSAQTAFQVTLFCKPTVYTTASPAVSTTTCSTTTVTTTGCSATGSTTTISTSSNSSTSAAPTQCNPDTCGNSCQRLQSSAGGKPTSTTAFDCKNFPTITVASDITVPTSESKRELGKLLLPLPLSPRALPPKEPETHDRDYVDELSRRADILPLAMGRTNTDGGFYPYPAPNTGRHVFGLQALTGCTVLIIASNKGVYVAHMWEVGAFMVPNGDQRATQERTPGEFRDIVIHPLRRGNAYAESIRELVGTDRHPGRLHRMHQPKVFVVSPYTDEFDRTVLRPPVTTNLRYEAMAYYLRDAIVDAVPGCTSMVTGYFREPEDELQGMVWLEVDREQRLEVRRGHSDRQIGMWRLWAGPDLVETREFRVTQRRHRGHKRALELGSGSESKRAADDDPDGDYEGDDGEEFDMPNPCPIGGAAGTGPNSDYIGGAIANSTAPGGVTGNGTDTSTGNDTAPVTSSASESVSASTSGRKNTATLTSLNHTATFTTVTSLNHPTTSHSLEANTTSSSGHGTGSKTISSPPITSCTLSSVAALSTAYSYYTIDYPATIECACNNGWTAGIANTVGSDRATTYYCEIGSTHIEVSTAPPKPTTTKAPVAVTTTSSAPYVTGTCNLHIFEASENYNEPLYMQFNISDSGNNLLASKNLKGKWGEIGTVSAGDTDLPYDVSIDFLKSTKVPSRMARDIMDREVATSDIAAVIWEDWVLTITAGSTKWDDTDKKGMPYCKVGKWDNGNFWDWLNGLVGDDTSIPNRQMDCHWLC